MEFWRRFEDFLRLTAERDIIVQIEVWATFDFCSRAEKGIDPWASNPFNPVNNVNYTTEESGLTEKIGPSPMMCDNVFFFTVPGVGDNNLLLHYQHAFVDKLLSYTLGCGHVLYCMDNETHVWPQWGNTGRATSRKPRPMPVYPSRRPRCSV